MSNLTNIDLGAVSAYAMAVAGGYQGTLEQFEADIGESATNATSAEESALRAEAFACGTRNGTAVSSDDEAYENNAKYYSERVNSSNSDDLNYILGV